MDKKMKIRLFTIPNILTLCNLLCGMVAVAYTVMQTAEMLAGGEFDFRVPLYMVLASSVFDYLDGASARLLKQSSPIGLQLDSLADMVSFGLVPSFLLAAMTVSAAGGVTPWAVAACCVALCSALRLAKFNIDESQKSSFEGMATPPCALLVASLAYWFTVKFGQTPMSPAVTAALAIVLSWLLVSPIRMFSLKFSNFGLEGINMVRYAFLAVALGILIAGGLKMIWCIIIVYLLTSLTVWLCGKRTNK